MAILIHKIKNLNFKKALSIILLAGLTATVISSPFAAAQGPNFSAFAISYDPAENMDLPMIDAKNLTTGSDFTKSGRTLSVNPGDKIGVQLYYHNGVPDEDVNVAINTFVKAFASPTLGQNAASHTLSASIKANNHAEIFSSTRGGNVTVNLANSSQQNLTIIPGTTKLYKNWGSIGRGNEDISQIINLGDNIFDGSGVSVGDVRGCWLYSSYINFQLQVSNITPGNLTIKKEVRNVTDGQTVFNDTEVLADPGEQVEYKITVSATGSQVTNVSVKDILDTKLAATGSVTLDDVVQSGGLFTSAGLPIGTVTTSASKVIKFKANVAAASQFTGNGPFFLPNTATAFTSTLEISDSANVKVVISAKVVVCTFTWDQPHVSATDDRGLRRVNDLANVREVVTGLEPNQSFNITVQHVSGTPTFRSLVTANSSGNYDVKDATPISSSFVVGNYNAYIEVGGAFVATCKGVRIEAPQVATVDIQKTVKNVTTSEASFSEQVNAAPGQRVMFNIRISTLSSNVNLTSVNVRDILPPNATNPKLIYAPGTFNYDGANQAPGNFFGSGGFNVGTLTPGQSKVITFEADVANASNFTTNCEILVNTTTLTADASLTDSDTASVNVCKTVVTKPSGTPGSRPN